MEKELIASPVGRMGQPCLMKSRLVTCPAPSKLQIIHASEHDLNRTQCPELATASVLDLPADASTRVDRQKRFLRGSMSRRPFLELPEDGSTKRPTSSSFYCWTRGEVSSILHDRRNVSIIILVVIIDIMRKYASSSYHYYHNYYYYYYYYHHYHYHHYYLRSTTHLPGQSWQERWLLQGGESPEAGSSRLTKAKA